MTSSDGGHAHLQRSFLHSIEQSQAIITSVTAMPPHTSIGERAIRIENTCKHKLAEAKQIPTAQKIKTMTALALRPAKIERDTKKEMAYGNHAINVT
jgi:hypothetical protein